MLADTLFAILAGQIFVIVPIVRHEMVPVSRANLAVWNMDVSEIRWIFEVFVDTVPSMLNAQTEQRAC